MTITRRECGSLVRPRAVEPGEGLFAAADESGDIVVFESRAVAIVQALGDSGRRAPRLDSASA
jgi:hypothetical protein